MKAELKKEFCGRIGVLLEKEGFQQRTRVVFTRVQAAGISQWIFFNTAVYALPDSVIVNPVVGVRHDGVERALAKALGEESSGDFEPTIAAPIGYCMPKVQYRNWVLGRRNATKIVEEISEAIRAHAIPFLARLNSLGGILDEMKFGSFAFQSTSRLRIPVVLVLLGREKEAKEEVRKRPIDFSPKFSPAEF